jgi:hypothetical protein
MLLLLLLLPLTAAAAAVPRALTRKAVLIRHQAVQLLEGAPGGWQAAAELVLLQQYTPYRQCLRHESG